MFSLIDPTRDYVQINLDSVVKIDGIVDDWPPREHRNPNGTSNTKKKDRYISMIFRVESDKPYQKRRRIKIIGNFLVANIDTDWTKHTDRDEYVNKIVEVWLDDVTFLFEAKDPRKKRITKPKPRIDFDD